MARALVTGGSRGIGAAIVRKLAQEGHDLVFTYHTSVSAAEQLSEELRFSGHSAIPIRFSMNLSDWRRTDVLEDLTAGEGFDILVNNAATSQEKPFGEIDSDDWDFILSTNLKAPFFLSKLVMPSMARKHWGRIVNIASIGGQWGGINQVHYAVSKAGLIGLTKSLARIGGAVGVTANAVSPGVVLTDMAKREIDSEEGAEKLRTIPVGRVGSTDEIAAVVAFLCSEEAGYITGQTINVNGGMYFG